MLNSTPTLLNLPPELILEISDHLPPDAILALKLTHSILNATLPLEPRARNTTLSNCARLAIRTYLSRTGPQPSHIRCILCKDIYPVNQFISSSSPACVPISFTEDRPRPEVVELPQRFCSWHVGRLARVITTESGGRNEWVSQMQEMCMHCGTIRGWDTCDCVCDSCSFRTVRTYTRFLNNNSECRRFLFWREVENSKDALRRDSIKGQLLVREVCRNQDATEQQTVINLPVHYEDSRQCATFPSALKII